MELVSCQTVRPRAPQDAGVQNLIIGQFGRTDHDQELIEGGAILGLITFPERGGRPLLVLASNNENLINSLITARVVIEWATSRQEIFVCELYVHGQKVGREQVEANVFRVSAELSTCSYNEAPCTDGKFRELERFRAVVSVVLKFGADGDELVTDDPRKNSGPTLRTLRYEVYTQDYSQ